MHSLSRRLWLIAILVAVLTAITATSLSGADADPGPPQDQVCNGQLFTFAEFRSFSQEVWGIARWERERPAHATIKAQRHRLRCAAGPGHRKAMKTRWRADQKQFYEHRSRMLWRTRVTPYPGGGHWWAIPYYIVVCESGGRYNDPSAPNGAYSLLAGPLQGVPTWETWRPSWASGYELPYQAPPKAQDLAAHKLYRAYGLEPWECA